MKVRWPQPFSSAVGGLAKLHELARWLLLATLLVPLVVFPGFFFPFVTFRGVYFRVLVEALTAILLYLVLRRDAGWSVRNDLVFGSLLIWIAAITLAAWFGVAPMRSFFGDHERMGGVWFWVHLLAFYVALRTFMRERDWWRFFRVSVAIAVTITVYGLIQFKLGWLGFGIAGIDSGVTIGNPGLLGAYLLANVALTAMLAVRAVGRARMAYGAVGLTLVAGVVFSGNRSSTLGLVLGSGVALVVYIAFSRTVRGRWLVIAAGLFAVFGALPFVASAPWARTVTAGLPAVAKLAGGVDSVRVVQWRAAVEGIRDRPVFGFGPENYQIVWSRFYHPEMNRFVADSRWDRAHNVFLDVFTTSGLFGLVAFLAVCLAMGWTILRSARARRDNDSLSEGPAAEAVALGFLVAYAFYLLFWFFDLNSTMLWIAVGAFVTSRAHGPVVAFGAPRERRWQTTLVLAAGIAAFIAVLYVHGFETLRMARTLDRVRVPGRSPDQLLQDYKSVFGSPAPVTQHVFPMYAGHLASLRPSFPEIKGDAASSALFDRAFILAIEEFERQAARDPFNEHVMVQHARVLMLGANYYGTMRLYESGLGRLHRAAEIAPRRVPTRLALGMAYLNIQRPEEALAELRKAYSLYPPLGQTQAYLGLAYASVGQNSEAVRWLVGASDAGYVLDHGHMSRISNALVASGHHALAAELTGRHLLNKYGPAFMWRVGLSQGDAHDYQSAKATAANFLLAGDTTAAVVIESAAEGLCGRATPLPDLAASALLSDERAPPNCRQPWRNAVSY